MLLFLQFGNFRYNRVIIISCVHEYFVDEFWIRFWQSEHNRQTGGEDRSKLSLNVFEYKIKCSALQLHPFLKCLRCGKPYSLTCASHAHHLFHTDNKILDYEIILSAHNLLESYIISYLWAVNERHLFTHTQADTVSDAAIWFTAAYSNTYIHIYTCMDAEKLICCWQIAHQIEW